jgi:cephalosporin hydroxylase
MGKNMQNPTFLDDYLKWYFDSNIWITTTFMGINCLKSVCDMWNYQEILYSLRPSLIVEGGTANGGSTLYFSFILRSVNPDSKVISIDINHSNVAEAVKNEKHIELLNCKFTDKNVISRIKELRMVFQGPIFVILDDDHTKKNVLAEMEILRDILVKGDYLVVEDGIVNGHPVLPGWGEGPLEAIEDYFKRYPHDYTIDTQREYKFGFTFAPKGFLIRN